MRPIFARVAVLFGFASLCLAAAVALELGRTSEPSRALDGDPSDVTGSIGGDSFAVHRLPLTDEQRGRIFDDIMKLADAPTAEVPAPDTTTVMPGSVALQDLPDSATRRVPLVTGYKFVKLDDRILLVSPVDRSVVAEMPRYRTVLE
jgi:hypothetical protein